MLEGKMGPLGTVTQGVCVGTSVMMAIPSPMAFLSLVIRPDLNRWTNIVFGSAFTLTCYLLSNGLGIFTNFFGTIVILLTASVAWRAWKWPRVE